MKLTAAQLRARFPTMPESTVLANASDFVAEITGPVQALPYRRPPSTMEERVLESVESESQQEVVKWWDQSCARLGLPEIVLMAFPLQGKRSRANGARMKAEGLRAGTWDMLLSVARFPFHGLWIENKTKLGTLTPEQIVFGSAQRAQGYATAVCRSSAEASQQIVDYLAFP